MKNQKQEAVSYTVEREYLSRITVPELVSRIIQVHLQQEKQNHWKTASFAVQ